MAKRVVTCDTAPKAIGPYSQAIRNGSWAFISGCLPADAVTGEIFGGDIKSQTKKVLENMGQVLKACKMEYKHVIKTTIFLTNLSDFADMNEVYGQVFSVNPPARSCVQVAALPKGALIEIEAICRKN